MLHVHLGSSYSALSPPPRYATDRGRNSRPDGQAALRTVELCEPLTWSDRGVGGGWEDRKAEENAEQENVHIVMVMEQQFDYSPDTE
ncbi:hypothetical protein BaRGS_00014517 [Batillaria attramentaria]|uniref:Uncharacterized protein n=1 Tax=Batillaria attramentaria TaxID=370345 RepID=A0ABD0L4H6_9CAEN